jgi:hypothetical protein
MSENATRTETAVKSRTAKQSASGSAEFQFPQFEMPKMEMPEVARDAATNWINQGPHF